jgi:hypothetical protein
LIASTTRSPDMTRITKPEELKGYSLTTIDFEEFSGFDDENLYTFPVIAAALSAKGISVVNCHIAAGANIPSTSGGAAARVIAGVNTISDPSGIVYVRDVYILFGKTPQIALGFFYQAPACKRVIVAQINLSEGTRLEEVFSGEGGYAGLLRAGADITNIQVRFEFNDEQSARSARVFIDDFAFATTFLWRYRSAIEGLAWAVVVLIGGILITPIGPFCIACIAPTSAPVLRAIGLTALVVGSFGLRFLRMESRQTPEKRRAVG